MFRGSCAARRILLMKCGFSSVIETGSKVSDAITLKGAMCDYVVLILSNLCYSLVRCNWETETQRDITRNIGKLNVTNCSDFIHEFIHVLHIAHCTLHYIMPLKNRRMKGRERGNLPSYVHFPHRETTGRPTVRYAPNYIIQWGNRCLVIAWVDFELDAVNASGE